MMNLMMILRGELAAKGQSRKVSLILEQSRREKPLRRCTTHWRRFLKAAKLNLFRWQATFWKGILKHTSIWRFLLLSKNLSYSCNICERAFSTISNLWGHIENNTQWNNQWKVYKCILIFHFSHWIFLHILSLTRHTLATFVIECFKLFLTLGFILKGDIKLVAVIAFYFSLKRVRWVYTESLQWNNSTSSISLCSCFPLFPLNIYAHSEPILPDFCYICERVFS